MSEPETNPARPTPAARRRGHGRMLVKLGLGAVVAAAFLYLFLRGSDIQSISLALAAAHPGYLSLALASAGVGFWVRALRWKRYLRPVKDVSLRNSFEILMIGYMISNFVPGRVGDIIFRPLLMNRSEGIASAATLATVAVERLFDTLMVVTFFALYLAAFAPPGLGGLDLGRARLLGGVLLAGSVIGVAALMVLRAQEARALGLLGRLVGPLGERWRERIMGQARAFARGLALFESPWNATVTVWHSLLAWLSVGAAMWLCALSLGLPVRPQDSLLLIGLGAVGVAIPTPGGVGSFHFFMLQGLGALGVTHVEIAQAAAILMWAVSFVPLTLLGLAAALRRGVRLAEIEAAAEDGTP